jgi:hypothetical protein
MEVAVIHADVAQSDAPNANVGHELWMSKFTPNIVNEVDPEGGAFVMASAVSTGAS